MATDEQTNEGKDISVAEIAIQTVARNLRRIRQERSKSLGQLERASTVRKGVISRVESGKQDTQIGTLAKLAHGLRVPLIDLLSTMEDGQD